MNLQLFSQEKTEAATPKRRQEAQRRGQVLKSTELTGALGLLAVSILLGQFGGRGVAGVAEASRGTWAHLPAADLTPGDLEALLASWALVALQALAPLAGTVLAVGVISNVVQVGGVFTLKTLEPDFSRLNPVQGLTRIFSRRALFESAKALVKMAIVGGVAYLTLRDELAAYPSLAGMPLGAAAAAVAGTATRVLGRIAAALLVLAVADYFYQRYEHEQSMKMTKQEVKEEHKQTEGSPELRARMRRRQRQMAARRMMQDLPAADVVITNPVHYAVALGYDAEQMPAPRVLAKGQGFLAQRIKAVAAAHGVPLVENRPLAQALYRGVEVGESIPADLYQAVAEVLAHVYRSRGKA